MCHRHTPSSKRNLSTKVFAKSATTCLLTITKRQKIWRKAKRGRPKRDFWSVSLFFYKRQDFASVGIAIFGTPLISFAPAPPKQAWAHPPAPVRGWTGPQVGYANTICRAAPFTAISFLMSCATATRPNSTFTLTFDLRRNRPCRTSMPCYLSPPAMFHTPADVPWLGAPAAARARGRARRIPSASVMTGGPAGPSTQCAHDRPSLPDPVGHADHGQNAVRKGCP